MRRIGEITLYPYFRHRFVGRYQQQARVHQPLPYEPFVGRFVKVFAELLLERREAPVALARQLLDRDVLEYVAVDNLFETLFGSIDIT